MLLARGAACVKQTCRFPKLGSKHETCQRSLDWEGIFRGVKNRMFFPQPPGMGSRRPGKYPPNPGSGARQSDHS